MGYSLIPFGLMVRFISYFLLLIWPAIKTYAHARLYAYYSNKVEKKNTDSNSSSPIRGSSRLIALYNKDNQDPEVVLQQLTKSLRRWNLFWISIPYVLILHYILQLFFSNYFWFNFLELIFAVLLSIHDCSYTRKIFGTIVKKLYKSNKDIIKRYVQYTQSSPVIGTVNFVFNIVKHNFQ